MADTAIRIQLPRGTWRDGAPDRTAELQPPSQDDETFFLDRASELTPAERTTGLLERSLTRLGGRRASRTAVRNLSVGDREALLLHLHRLIFGESIPCVVTCPSHECGAAMELELTVSALLGPAPLEVHELHEATVGRRRAVFRVPTGADQENAAEIAAEDIDAAADRILRSCVKTIGGRSRLTKRQLQELREALPPLMAELDPQADIVLQLVCPDCELAFSVPFDAGAYLESALRDRRAELLEDVHQLAVTYHWAEAEILALPAERRRLYLDLIGRKGARA